MKTYFFFFFLGEKGLKGLEFWLRSLAIHLPNNNNQQEQNQNNQNEQENTENPENQNHEEKKENGVEKEIEEETENMYSIVVVGTHLDHPNVKLEGKTQKIQLN